MQVLTIGGATQDTIITYNDPETLQLQSARGHRAYMLLEEGRKIEVTTQHVYTGGGATNSAVAFKHLGFDVGVFCKLGQDLVGAKILQELREFNIKTDHVVIAEDVHTASSYIVPSLKGDRTVFAFRGANAKLVASELPHEAIADVDLVYITSLSGVSAQCLPEIAAQAKKNDTLVAINPGISQLKLGRSFLKKALRDIDVLILNSLEAKQFMVSLVLSETVKPRVVQHGHGVSEAIPPLLMTPITHEDISFSLPHFFTAVLALGPELVVVTDGEAGIYVATAEHMYYHGAFLNKVVNTVGAGDAFGATFVAAWYRDQGIEQAIRYGLINAASVVGSEDAKSGLLSKEAIAQQISQLNHDDLQIYVLPS